MTVYGLTNLAGEMFLKIGRNSGNPDPFKRALLQFHDVPPDCGTVDSAVLHMYYYKDGSVSPARNLKVHKVCDKENNLHDLHIIFYELNVTHTLSCACLLCVGTVNSGKSTLARDCGNSC